MPTKPSARSGEGPRQRPAQALTHAQNHHPQHAHRCHRQLHTNHTTPCSTLANRAGTNNRGIADNTAGITNAKTKRVTYTALSNTTASSTITTRATGGTTT